MNKIQIEGMLKEGIGLGLKNLVPIVVNVLLFILTCWIPYLNVGTMIGLITMPSKIAKGETIGMTEIFDPAYRKNMGDVFLCFGFIGSGVGIGMALFFVPGLVIMIAWSLALLLVVDKNYDAIGAIKKSNELTYGNKAAIFFGQLIVQVLVMIAVGIVSWLLGMITPILGMLVSVAGMVCYMSIMLGVNAYVYKTLALEA